MDISRILDIGMKSMTIITSLAQQGKDITRAVNAAKNVFSKDVGQITDEDLDTTERELDEMLDEFEKPLNRKV
jgi:hypothetical protein